MDTKTYAEVYETMSSAPTTGQVIADLTKQVEQLRVRNEQLEMVASYAKDVIDFWPSMTFRTVRIMIPKMDSLKQALNLLVK